MFATSEKSSRLNLRLTDEQMELITRWAGEDHRSISEIVRIGLDLYAQSRGRSTTTPASTAKTKGRSRRSPGDKSSGTRHSGHS